MEEKQLRKKLVVLLVNGFGVSFGLKGNAILAAKPKQFTELWSNYPRIFISPTRNFDIEEPVNRIMQFLRFSTGDDLDNPVDVVEKALKSSQFSENDSLKYAIDYTKKHHSSLHLIQTLSKRNILLELRIIEKILQSAKINNVFDVNLHLVASHDWDSFEEIGKYLSRVDVLTHQNIGSVASFSGGSSVFDGTIGRGKLHSFLESLSGMSSKRCLSLSQTIARYGKKNPFLVEPVLILPDQKRGAKIQSFDSIIYSSFENAKTKELIATLSRETLFRARQLNFLLLQNVEYLPVEKYAFPIERPKSVFNILRSHDKKIALVGENSRASLYSNNLFYDTRPNASYLLHVPATNTAYLQKLGHLSELVLQKSKELICDKEHDLVLIDLPYLERSADLGSFRSTTHVVKLIDSFISKIKDVILENDSTLLITGLFGMAEKMEVKTVPFSTSVYCTATKNPLPVMLISNQIKSVRNHPKIGETLVLNGQVSDIAPTINEFLIDKKSDGSFLDKLK